MDLAIAYECIPVVRHLVRCTRVNVLGEASAISTISSPRHEADVLDVAKITVLAFGIVLCDNSGRLATPPRLISPVATVGVRFGAFVLLIAHRFCVTKSHAVRAGLSSK